MFSIAGIDLLEQELLDHERTLLEILLQDKTTKKNIIWATDDYAELGEPYSFKKEILPELVTGEQDSLIQQSRKILDQWQKQRPEQQLPVNWMTRFTKKKIQILPQQYLALLQERSIFFFQLVR